MNDTERTGISSEPYKQIISDHFLYIYNIYVSALLSGSMAIFGTLANVINVLVFYSLGIKDSMSVYLFALSFSDFLVSASIIFTRILFIWNFFYTGEGIDPISLAHVAPSFLSDSLFICSGWILTFMSMERCICVTFPFKVKRIFTRNRALASVVTIYVIIMVSHVPVYVTQWLGWQNYTVTTTTGYNERGSGGKTVITAVKHRLVVMYASNREQVMAYAGIVNSTLIPVPSLILTFGSAVWMTYGLIASSKLRQSMTLKTSGNTRDVNPCDTSKPQESKITQKTRKLVQAVLVLGILFLICSTPRIIATYITNIISPEINPGGKEHNLSLLIWSVTRLAATLNASVNIFVYLTINSQYRLKFLELFACVGEKDIPREG